MITEEITLSSILSQYYRILPEVISVVKIDVCSVVASLVTSVVESVVAPEQKHIITWVNSDLPFQIF